MAKVLVVAVDVYAVKGGALPKLRQHAPWIQFVTRRALAAFPQIPEKVMALAEVAVVVVGRVVGAVLAVDEVHAVGEVHVVVVHAAGVVGALQKRHHFHLL